MSNSRENTKGGDNLTSQMILEKAIQKAIDGGWEGFSVPSNASTFMLNKGQIVHVGHDLIFDHSFARALWGERLWDSPQGYLDTYLVEKWKIMLQNMVIADDPIQYLGENL